MYSAPPMFPTELKPIDIIGLSNMPLFREFYQIVASEANSGEYPDKQLNKKFGPEDRKAIAETLRHLREHGFYPTGYDKNNQIVWRTMLKSQVQIEMEKGLAELEALPEKQLMDMARRGYVKAVKSVNVKPVSETEGIYEATVSK